MHNKKQAPYTLYSLAAPLIVVAVVIGIFVYKDQVGKTIQEESVLSASKNGNSNKGGNSGSSSDKGKSNSNSQQHKEIIDQAVTGITEVSEKLKGQGKSEIAETLDNIANEIEEQSDETLEVIEEIDNMPKWKELLVGVGYKNLGQLRSVLAQNTNMIRKLNQEMASLGPGENTEALQSQLMLLNQERERIQTTLNEHENEFSILGWFTKIFGSSTKPGGAGIETTQSTEPEL